MRESSLSQKPGKFSDRGAYSRCWILRIAADDFLNQDISEADIVFINATCFDDFFDDVIIKLRTLKVGARIILSTVNLDDIGGFELCYAKLHLMSWGLNTIRIYQRV